MKANHVRTAHDSRNRTTRTGHLGQDSWSGQQGQKLWQERDDRSARTCQAKTAGTGQLKLDNLDRTVMQESQDMSARTGQPGNFSLDWLARLIWVRSAWTRQRGEDGQNMTARQIRQDR